MEYDDDNEDGDDYYDDDYYDNNEADENVAMPPSLSIYFHMKRV